MSCSDALARPKKRRTDGRMRLPALVVVTALFAPLPVLAQAPQGPDTCAGTAEAAAERIVAACDALLAAPDTPDAKRAGWLRARAEAYIRQDRLPLAVADLDQVSRLDDQDGPSVIKRAGLRRTLGDTDGLIADLSMLIRLQPDNVAALFERGTLYRGKGDLRRALADFGAVLRREPAHAAAAAERKALAQEIERLGATMPLTHAPKP
jgi:tetratricopeptide (TPR) repeat protein